MAFAPGIIINLPPLPINRLDSVSTIAALRSIPSVTLSNGQDIIVDGNSYVGDGGGNVFTWSELSVADDDGLTVIRPNDVTPLLSGRWVAAGKSAIDGLRDLATPTSPGLMTASDYIKLTGIVDMKALGAQFNSDYDNASIYSKAIDALGDRGGKINHGRWGMLYTSADIDLPPNILYKGVWYPQKPRLSWDYLTTCPSGVILEPSKTIKMNGSKIENLLLWQANINQNPPTPEVFYEELAKFDGNAFTATGDDICVHQCMMIGFARAGLVYNVFRPEVTENVFDCLGGFDVSAVYDFRGRGISNNLGQAIYIQFRPWPIAVTRRPGKAIYVHDVADGVTVKDNKSYGYLTGLHLKNVFGVKASHWADGPALPDPIAGAGTRGIWLEGLLNSCEISSSHSDGQETGYYIEAAGNLQLGTNSCGFALLNQVYLGAATHGAMLNMSLSGNCQTPISAAAGVGEWHGTVDSTTFAGSGNLLFHLDATGDKNKLKDLIRRQPDPAIQMADPFPQFIGEYTFSTKPSAPKPGTRIRVLDASNSPTAFGSTLTGGGSNIVEAVFIAGIWRVG